MIKDKCCFDPASPDDGLRLMTTARYPRGQSRDICDVFLPDLAPDWEVLQSLRAGEVSWFKFLTLYRQKLRKPAQKHQLELLAAVSETLGQTITVMCACEDRERCHRSVLAAEIKASYRNVRDVRPVHPYCIYHIKHSDELNKIHEQGGVGELEENGSWRKARSLFEEAQHTGERLLLLFDHAEHFVGVSWVAEIEDVEIVPQGDRHTMTRIKIRDLTPLPAGDRFPHHKLKRESNGEFLSKDYQRGYVPCITPNVLVTQG